MRQRFQVLSKSARVCITESLLLAGSVAETDEHAVQLIEPSLGQAAHRGFRPALAALQKDNPAMCVSRDRQIVEGGAWRPDWTETSRTSTSIADTATPALQSGLSRFAYAPRSRWCPGTS